MSKIGWGLLFLFLFFVSDPYLHAVDKRIYTHYTVSLIEDLDLNVVNQIPEKESWLLTTTLNYPDVHSNGISLLWSPFFAATWLLSPWTSLSHEVLYRQAQPLANLFWGFMALALLWSLLLRHFPKNISIATLGIVLMVTPFLWNLTYQPENADITSLVFATALLHFYGERKSFKPYLFCFLLGAFLLAGAALKFDLIFYGILFAHFLYDKNPFSLHGLPLRRHIGYTLSFALGAFPMLIFISINESLKAGFLDNPYLNTVSGNIYVLYENLLAPSGYFRTQPFWILLILTFPFLFFRQRKNSFVLFLFFIPITEIVLESFNYNHNEGFSSRHWINDIPCWALVIATTLQSLEHSKWKKLFLGAAFLGGFFTFTGSLVYRLDFENYYFTGDWWTVLLNLKITDLLYYVKPKGLHGKIVLLPIAVLAVIIGFLLLNLIGKEKTARWTVILFSGFSVLYAGMTLANVRNNRRSAQAVPNRTSQAVIGHGPHINGFFENAGCLQRAVEYYRIRQQPETAQKRQLALEAYVQKAAEEIQFDPIGFKDSLLPGRKHYVPQHLWSDD